MLFLRFPSIHHIVTHLNYLKISYDQVICKVVIVAVVTTVDSG